MFEINNKIKSKRRRNYVIVIEKNDVKISEMIKYVYYLQKYKNSKNNIKFHENENFYFLKYELNHTQVFSKSRFYFSEINIDQNQIHIAAVSKKKYRQFCKLFKPFESSICNSLTSDFMGKLLSGHATEEDIKSFEILLHETCKSLGIDFINEFACSMAIVPVLLGFAKYNKVKNIKNFLYAVEKYMSVDKKIRRCDGIYDYADRLIILEYKMNIFDEQNPLTYIGERDYVKHLIKYLMKYEKHMLEGKKTIGQIGIKFYKETTKVEIAEDIQIDDLIKEIENEESYIFCVDKKITKKKIKQMRFKKRNILNNISHVNLNQTNKTNLNNKLLFEKAEIFKNIQKLKFEKNDDK